MFYFSNHNTRIVEIGNNWFIESGEMSESEVSQNTKIKEIGEYKFF